jgi:hypothetical protein
MEEHPSDYEPELREKLLLDLVPGDTEVIVSEEVSFAT